MASIIIRDCPHCPAQNSYFRIVYTDAVPNRAGWHNCCAVCGACHGPICFQTISTKPNSGNPTLYPGNIEDNKWVVSQVWPARLASSAPPHTPPQVKARYEEGEDAYERGKWNSAVAMYRSALDIATKAMKDVPKSVTFFERLKWLHDHHAITPDIKTWADHVRVEGNAALHEPDEFNEDDAKALRFFTEMFLRYVFELPGAVREFRGQPESPTPPMVS